MPYQSTICRQYKAITVCFFCALLLTGCVNIVQEIWVEPNGGGRCKIQIFMDELAVALKSKDELAETIRMVAQNPENNEENFEVTNAVEGVVNDQHYYIYEIQTADIQNCMVMGNVQLVASSLTPVSERKIAFIQTFSYQQDQASSFLESFIKGSGELKEVDLIAELLFSSVYKDRYWFVKLHVPGEIVYTNGDYNEADNVTTWQVPLVDIIGPKARPVKLNLEYLVPGEKATFFERIRIKGLSPTLLAVLGIFALLSLGACIYGLRPYFKLKSSRNSDTI